MSTLRILAISHMYPIQHKPQYGIFITREMEYLTEYGIECDFLVPRPWAPWPMHLVPRWREYGPQNKLIGPPDFRAEIVKYPRPPGFRFRRFDGRIVGHRLKGKARRWHRERGYDVVLGVSMFPDAEAAVIVGRALRLPVATLAVGSDVMVYPGRMPLLWERLGRTLANVDLVAGVSQMICDRMAETSGPRHKPLCVYLGRDTSMFTPVDDKRPLRKRLGWGADDVVAIYVGHVLDAKGMGELSQVAPELLTRYPRLRVVIVGDGPAREKLARAGERCGRDGAVVLAGRVQPEDVPLYLQASDFLVFPSYSEGMPQAVLEAMNCGLAAVATRVGGVPEAVVDGETGILIDAKSPDQLRDAMESMITDESFRQSAGQKGWARAGEVFCPHRNARRFADALWALSSRASAPGA